jgi:hypothetical protein
MRRLDDHVAEIFDTVNSSRMRFSRVQSCDVATPAMRSRCAKSSAKFGVLRGLRGTHSANNQ